MRDHILTKIHSRFPSIPQNTVKNVEISIYNYIIDYSTANAIQTDWSNYLFKHAYISKFLEVMDYLSGDGVLDHIIKHKLAKDICNLSDVRFSPGGRKNINIVSTEIADGMFKCPKCRSKKTTYYSIQTRSADEPMTNFITCIECKHRWRN